MSMAMQIASIIASFSSLAPTAMRYDWRETVEKKDIREIEWLQTWAYERRPFLLIFWRASYVGMLGAPVWGNM